jgi:hypothetical protein
MPWVHENWEDLIHWMASHFKGKSLLSIVTKLMLAAIVYTIRNERNTRLFQRNYKDTLLCIPYGMREILGCSRGITRTL